MRKKKSIEVTWNGKKVSVKLDGFSWIITPLEGQRLSQQDKIDIITAVAKYG